MGKRYVRRGLNNRVMGRREAVRYAMTKKSSKGKQSVSAGSIARAIVWAVENPRHWRKLSALMRTQGMTDAAVLNWLMREWGGDGRSMRYLAELAHELSIFERVIGAG